MGLLLHKEKSYFATGRYVVLDYCFCVLKWLIELRKKCVLFCAVIKKRIYWSSVVSGKEIEDHFWWVEVEDTDSIHGTVDNVIYNLWGMKPNYGVRIMDTCGRLLLDDICKETVKRWK